MDKINLMLCNTIYDTRTEVSNTYDRLQSAFSLVQEATFV